MATLLLTDDDAAIRESLALALRMLGHEVDVAADGAAALAHLQRHPQTDAILLDVMMPGLSGFDVCRRIRRTSQLPVIMLTARGQAADVVAGLECGADDYVTKPVDPRVLDARVRAVLRRASPEPTATWTVGTVRVDEQAVTVTCAGRPIALTATEFRLLVALGRHAGHVLSRSQLLDLVWEYGYDGDSRLVDATIQRLRAKLDLPGEASAITTVRGMGYRLERA